MKTSRTAPRTDVAALVSTIVTALLMLMFLANSASAQIKLGGKPKTTMANALPSVVTPSADGVKTGSVTFDERVLEITAERLDQFLAGLDAEVEMAARVNAPDLDAIDRANAAADAGYQKDMAAFEAQAKVHDKCAGAISSDLEKQMAPGMPTEQDRAKMEVVAALKSKLESLAKYEAALKNN